MPSKGRFKQCFQRRQSSKSVLQNSVSSDSFSAVSARECLTQAPMKAVSKGRFRRVLHNGISQGCLTKCSARVPDRLPFTQQVRVSFRSVLRTVSYEVSYEVAPQAPLRSASLKKPSKSALQGKSVAQERPNRAENAPQKFELTVAHRSSTADSQRHVVLSVATC